MTALAINRDTPLIGGPVTPEALAKQYFPVAASTTIYAGSIVGVDSSGNAGPVSTTFSTVVGRAESQVVNSGIAGAASIEVQPGVFPFVNGDSIGAGDYGVPLYAGDDQTVYKSAGTGRVFAGMCYGLEGTQVKAGIGAVFSAISGSAVGAVGSLAAFAANTITPSAISLVSGATYDVPTTAGVSTIVLPADSPVGTRVCFAADGTKNGHTVQYIDATGSVALTTALTASKRHHVICTKLSATIWVAIAYTSP